MRFTALIALCALPVLVSACSTYTDQTSSCFGKNGKPKVGQTLAYSAVAGSDCTFRAIGFNE